MSDEALVFQVMACYGTKNHLIKAERITADCIAALMILSAFIKHMCLNLSVYVCVCVCVCACMCIPRISTDDLLAFVEYMCVHVCVFVCVCICVCPVY